MLSLLIALALALPLGFILSKSRHQKLSRFLVRATSLIQTMPGLAMLALMVVLLALVREVFPIATTGMLPGILTLSLYGISPILTNAYTGITQVSPAMIDVAEGLGMTRQQTLFQVQMPHAVPMIMAGIRIAGVWTIGMCTLVSLVGSGGLGDLILQGLRSMNARLVLAGTIPAALLAALFEWSLSSLEKWLTVRR
jgi:osmoprotectant transport system permease protein